MSLDIPFEHAFAMERAIRTFLAARGVPTIPCNEFSGRNEEHQQAPTTFVINEETGRIERLILPDLIRWPTFRALEIKTQGYAPFMAKAGCRTTGFQKRHLDHYRRYERESGRQVDIAFVHLVEGVIVGGSLDEIDPFRSRAVNLKPDHRDWFWEFERLRPWPESLDDFLTVALRHGPRLGAEGYTQTDHQAVVQYRETVARPNYAKHSASWPRAWPTNAHQVVNY